jgi:hypothetical protein
MTLNRHRIDGLPKILDRTMAAAKFERLLVNAGYSQIGSASAQGKRVKIWWAHPSYRRVEVIYSNNLSTVITAYHVNRSKSPATILKFRTTTTRARLGLMADTAVCHLSAILVKSWD